jgi:predicted PurR-regulated permease PerM
MNQNWLVTGFFFALLIAILYGTFLILSPFLKALTWAAILAVLFYPAYAELLKLMRGRATLAAFTIIVLIALIIVIPGLRMVGFLSEEIVLLVRSVGSLVRGEGVDIWQQKPWVQMLLRAWDALGMHLAQFNFDIDWRDAIIQGAQTTSTFLVSHLSEIAQNVLLFAANFVIVLFTLFFFLRDGADFCYRLRHLLPMDHEHQERLFDNIVSSLTAVVHGCLAVALIQGLLAGLAYGVLGVPFALVWGVVTAFAALLPIGGTMVVSVPASIYLFVQGETVRGVILLIWCIGVVGMVDNILKPIFIGTRLRLPMVALFFGILGGVAVFGALGLVLGPVLFGLLSALLDLYLEEYAEARDETQRLE